MEINVETNTTKKNYVYLDKQNYQVTKSNDLVYRVDLTTIHFNKTVTTIFLLTSTF